MNIEQLLTDTSIQESNVIIEFQDGSKLDAILASDEDGIFLICEKNSRISVIEEIVITPDGTNRRTTVSSITFNIVVDMNKKSKIYMEV